MTLSSDAILDHKRVDAMYVSLIILPTHVRGWELTYFIQFNKWLFSFPRPRTWQAYEFRWLIVNQEGELN